MKMRKVTSLIALLSFLVLMINSIVLYIAPHGRVANWAVWRVMGLTKTHWTNQHVILGVLFLLAVFLHIYYNWKPMVSYLKNKAKRIKVMTAEFNIALIVTVVCIIGSYHPVPPFSWVLDFSESVKNSAETKYGARPFGQAEVSSLKTFVSKTGLNRATALLKKEGIAFENEKQTIQEIAELNKISPQQLYVIMKSDSESGPSHNTNVVLASVSGDTAQTDTPTGLGKLTLSEVMDTYKLDRGKALEKLAAKGIPAKPEDKMRKIAEDAGLSPSELYRIIQ